MSIDKSITELEILKKNTFSYMSAYRAFTTAVNIMRKYQKIKEQVDIAIDKENFAISGARLIQIREIINGNDD